MENTLPNFKHIARPHDYDMPPEEPDYYKCPLCNGDGYQVCDGDDGWDKYDCPRCQGTGREE